jgi:hypothetical protein
LGLNPNLDRVVKRKPHFILSKVFSKSSRSKTRSCSLFTTHSSDSWTKKFFFKNVRPHHKVGLVGSDHKW